MYERPTHTIVFNEDSLRSIRSTIENIISQAKNGVTVFNTTGAISSMFIDLNLAPITKD